MYVAPIGYAEVASGTVCRTYQDERKENDYKTYSFAQRPEKEYVLNYTYIPMPNARKVIKKNATSYKGATRRVSPDNKNAER
jgi:hypothetical protein